MCSLSVTVCTVMIKGINLDPAVDSAVGTLMARGLGISSHSETSNLMQKV